MNNYQQNQTYSLSTEERGFVGNVGKRTVGSRSIQFSGKRKTCQVG